uniref:Uncharacterized protein n=1 Tax=Physcomitrium patens TaxID=3218 RepID=A0A2K1KAP7_PHYPA|nr:hypothetical protein PHYPA_010032 [Physcomitrium patens]
MPTLLNLTQLLYWSGIVSFSLKGRSSFSGGILTWISIVLLHSSVTGRACARLLSISLYFFLLSSPLPSILSSLVS